MMIQPRAYMYRPSSPEKDGRRKSTIRSSSPKTAPSPLSARRPSSTPLPEPKQPEPVQAQPEPKPAFVGRTASEPVKIPISQMLVQPRYHPSARSRNTTDEAQSSKSRGLHGGWSNRKLNEKHDPSALPPAVAALLAVTSIPPPSRINRRRTSQQRRISIDELIEEWRQEDKLSSSAEKYKSPLDILLEPADEAEDEDDGLLAGTEDEKDTPVLSSRSVSSDSISSTPSLAPSLDPTHSTVSSASTPRTPSYHRKVKPLSIRTDKVVSSPPAEQCLDSHPLQTPVVTESFIIPEKAFPPRQKPVVKQKSSFKSNLTASFSALKSAAKSFSNFTAPSIPQDDLLTRSFFSQPYPPEMRPRDIDGVPDPALRRYLNPQHNTLPPLSSDDFSLRFQEALAQPTTEPDDSPLVQMQTFSRRGKKSRVRSTSGVSVGPDRGEASVLGQSLPAIRQREPRENSDFLRVIVLEMNMRRTGKLDARAALRARIWLPPRKNGEGNGGGSEVEVRGGKEVPMRWVGLCLDDL